MQPTDLNQSYELKLQRLKEALFKLWEAGRDSVPDMDEEEYEAWREAGDLLSEDQGKPASKD